MSNDRCINRIHESGFVLSERCSRQATGEDRLCNICRAARKRSEAARRKRDERDAEKRANEALADERCGELLRLGIKARPYYRPSYGSGLGTYTGEVVVDPNEVIKAVCGEGYVPPPREEDRP